MRLTSDVDWDIRSYFSGEPAARGMVIDLTLYDNEVADHSRYLAVVRSPSGYLEVGRFRGPDEATLANERFWDGMRELLGPK